MSESEKEMILPEDFAVVLLPKSAVEVELKVTVYKDGELLKVGRNLDMEQIKLAFHRAETGYIDDDDVFYLTEKGKKLAEQYDSEDYFDD